LNSDSAALRSSDPLAVALLPVLLHKLAGTTQLLSGLNALLGIEGGEEFALTRSDDLGAASKTAHDLGWLMAVLASAGGTNLLLERREPRGITIVLDVLSDALSRTGRAMRGTGLAPPALAPDVLDGWQVPWSIGALLLAAANDLPPDVALDWSLETSDAGGVRLSANAGDSVARIAPLVEERLPGAELAVGEGRFALSLPADWLARDAGL
jgi:hypothetical protein